MTIAPARPAVLRLLVTADLVLAALPALLIGLVPMIGLVVAWILALVAIVVLHRGLGHGPGREISRVVRPGNTSAKPRRVRNCA